MLRKFLPRLLAAAATLIALVAAVSSFAGAGFASGSAAQANYAPTATAPPTISGTTQVGQTLTATSGSWSYQSQPSYAYQWLRCDSGGNNCASVSGATASTYKLADADNGHTMRVTVTASNAQGSSQSTSSQTAAVSSPGPAGAIKLPNGKTSIPATSVVLPDRLVIDGVQYQPRVVVGRGPFIARYHVSDTNGYVVRGALVYALGIPYSWTGKATEVETDETGWATVTVTQTAKMPKRAALMMFVRARVAGQNVLAASSTRRLSQVYIRHHS